jgi:transcriptional regulator with XRE-family HTH domain
VVKRRIETEGHALVHVRKFSGKRVRRARELAGMTRADLAAALDVSVGYVVSIETGHRTGMLRWAQLSAVLEVPIDSFFVADDDAVPA